MYLALNRARVVPRRFSNGAHGATAVDQLFDGFFNAVPTRDEQAGGSLAARFDVLEKGDRYEARIEVPGVTRDEIDVQIDGATIRVKAEPKAEPTAVTQAADVSQADQGTVLHSTRTTRSWFRNFTLPTEVDDARAEAAYENGVLTLTLPKKEVAQPKRLAIR